MKFVIHIYDVSERLGQTKFACFRGVEKISSVPLNADPPGSGYQARTYSNFKMRPLKYQEKSSSDRSRAYDNAWLSIHIFVQEFNDYTIVFIINVLNVDLMRKTVLRKKSFGSDLFALNVFLTLMPS
jgi:hypothetical protein